MTSSLRLVRADVAAVGPELIADESVDCAVFSPPYFTRDGWSEDLLRATGILLRRALRPGARAWMVFGQVKEDFLRPQRSALALLEGGGGELHAWQKVSWAKALSVGGPVRGQHTPLAASKHLLFYGHEDVYQFVRGKPKDAPPIDKLACGVPYADEGNLKRGNRGTNGNLRDAGDVWFAPYATTGKTRKKAHRHAFPAALARRAILTSGLAPGSTVLDCFVGGGTVAIAALRLGHHAVGIDLDRACVDLTARRWVEAGGSAPEVLNAGGAAPGELEDVPEGRVARASLPETGRESVGCRSLSWSDEPTEGGESWG